MANQYSRLKRTEAIIVEGNETLGTWVEPSWIREKPSDDLVGVFRVTNQFEGRPDLIANQIYNTPHLAWVLIAFNARFNSDTQVAQAARRALNWPRSGQTIIYPLDSIVFPEVV